MPCGAIVNCVVNLDRNEYRGNTTVSVRVVDIGYADTDREQMIADVRAFESLLRGEITVTPHQALMSREQLAHFYNMLRVCKEWNGTVEQLQHALGEPTLSCLQLLTALEIWKQAGLVSWYDKGDLIRIRVCPVEGKVDLTQTPLWQKIMKGDAENGRTY